MLSIQSMHAYQALFNFCSWGLYEKPTAEELFGLAGTREIFLMEPFSQVSESAGRAFAQVLEKAVSEEGLAELVREVHLDHTYLFRMVGSSHTSPYESVYRTDDSTMFGPTTLEVRAAYKNYGLQFERAANEPDDHIALELAFVAYFMSAAADFLAEGDAEKSERALDAAKRFLSEHLLVFAPVYLGNVQKRAQSGFYAALAGIAEKTLSSLAEALGAEAVEGVDERYIL